MGRAPFEARRILWIGAHPDDELLVAPLLGRLCVEESSACSMIVMTRGENGSCELPGGCSDLGALREQEMRAAAVLFRSALVQWTYRDAMSDVDTAWPHDEIVQRLRDAIALEAPTVVITFDPQHGSTGHPAHRALGALVREAAGDTPLMFVETTATLSDRYHFANARPDRAIAVDARTTWHYLTEDAAIHGSQFSAPTLASLAATPAGEQRLYLARP